MTLFLDLLRRFWYVIPIVILYGLWHFERAAHHELQLEYTAFKGDVKAAALQADLDHQKQIANSEKEKSNAQLNLSNALDANRRLLADAAAARAGRGYLPAVPTGAGGANKPACFDRPKLDAALSTFGAAVAGLIGEGTDAAIYRDGWHRWFDGQVRAFGPPR